MLVRVLTSHFTFLMSAPLLVAERSATDDVFVFVGLTSLLARRDLFWRCHMFCQPTLSRLVMKDVPHKREVKWQ